jgi:alkylation response protein AidB-like acyl-CoA dehydrogenase
MDLELTDEQLWLAESVEQLLATTPAERTWPALVEFGAPAIASGADGLGAVELVLVGRALGEALAAVPFLDTAAVRYAMRGAPPEVVDLTAVAPAVSLCLLEPGAGWELARSTTRVTERRTGASVVNGYKVAVQDAGMGDLFVLYHDGDDRRLALISRDATGVEITPAPAVAIDESLPLSAVALHGVVVPDEHSLPPELSEVVLARLLEIGGVLAASEAVGAAAALLALAREYAAQRRQFGRTIGSFQALRHLLADMHVKQTSASSTVLFAAAALEDDIEDASRTARVAKAYASRATLEVAHGAMQVFGGIAFTAEHPAHRFLRRILARGGQFGDARHHERMIGRELAEPARHVATVNARRESGVSGSLTAEELVG